MATLAEAFKLPKSGDCQSSRRDIHQSQTASNESPGRPPWRPPPPAAHQPHHDRQYRHPWQPNTPSQRTHCAYSLRPISTPASAQPVGRTRPLSSGSPPRHSDIDTEPCRQTQLLGAELLGAGEDDRVRTRITLRRRPWFVGVSPVSVEYSPPQPHTRVPKCW